MIKLKLEAHSSVLIIFSNIISVPDLCQSIVSDWSLMAQYINRIPPRLESAADIGQFLVRFSSYFRWNLTKHANRSVCWRQRRIRLLAQSRDARVGFIHAPGDYSACLLFIAATLRKEHLSNNINPRLRTLEILLRVIIFKIKIWNSIVLEQIDGYFFFFLERRKTQSKINFIYLNSNLINSNLNL